MAAQTKIDQAARNGVISLPNGVCAIERLQESGQLCVRECFG